jgi:topoisomerase-4 subunit A
MESGFYKLYNPDVSTHFEEDLIVIEHFNPRRPISAIYFDGETKELMVKRFLIEPTDKKTLFISESPNSHLEFVSTATFPMVRLEFGKMGKFEKPSQDINLDEFIGVKGLKAKGKKLAQQEPKKIIALEPLAEPEEPIEEKISGENEAIEDTEVQPNIVIDIEDDDSQLRLL